MTDAGGRIINSLRILMRAFRALGSGLSTMLVALLVVESLVPAATALALAALVDGVYRLDGRITGLVAPLATFGVVLVLGHLAEAGARPLEFLARAWIDGAHRTRVLELVTAVPTIGTLENPKVQQLVKQVSADPKNLVDYTPADGAVGLLRVATGALGLVASSVVLTRYAWWLVPILLAPALVVSALRNRQAFALVGKLRFAYREEMYADVWRQATISPVEGKDVRVFGLGEWMVRRMDEHILAANSPFWDHVIAVIRNRGWQFLLVLAGLLPVYVLVTVGVVAGHSTVAVQTAVFAAGWSLFLALGSSEDVQRMVGAVLVLRGTDQLAEELGRQHQAGNQTPTWDHGPTTVRFEDVGFAYPGAQRQVLSGVDLTIRPGELVALVGMNGAGKSTLIKLLSGLYRPTQGRITVNGVDMSDLEPQVWPGLLSVVFQDFVRYPLSAADNVALGSASVPADLGQVEAAGHAAGLDRLVKQLPNGWDTVLTRSHDGGVDLSGGQWQQVVLARALYAVRAGARVLVLDEPTAHLDVRTEFEVFERLADQRGTTSVVLISHRLSTVRLADRIVLLDGGRITESGTHDELIARGGAYAEMFAIQAERFRRGYDDRIQEDELL